jgi:hypothetical protein
MRFTREVKEEAVWVHAVVTIYSHRSARPCILVGCKRVEFTSVALDPRAIDRMNHCLHPRCFLSETRCCQMLLFNVALCFLRASMNRQFFGLSTTIVCKTRNLGKDREIKEMSGCWVELNPSVHNGCFGLASLNSHQQFCVFLLKNLFTHVQRKQSYWLSYGLD